MQSGFAEQRGYIFYKHLPPFGGPQLRSCPGRVSSYSPSSQVTSTYLRRSHLRDAVCWPYRHLWDALGMHRFKQSGTFLSFELFFCHLSYSNPLEPPDQKSKETELSPRNTGRSWGSLSVLYTNFARSYLPVYFSGQETQILHDGYFRGHTQQLSLWLRYSPALFS